MKLEFRHVDVFTSQPYSGNSLPVFLDAGGLSARQMLRITQELRHFEAIFLERTERPDTVRARVFDLFEELPFAGHPVIGAAAALHEHTDVEDKYLWNFCLPDKTVTVATERTETGFFGLLEQGRPEIIGPPLDQAWMASAFGLESSDLHRQLPVEIVSTGLRYLIVPLIPEALGRARIARDISSQLEAVGAQFAVLWDESAAEARHWNNDGVIEDVATGSAAGTIGAYRLRHGLARSGETFVLHQGRFTGRPSILRVCPVGSSQNIENVSVGGDVAMVGRGWLDVRP
ncbi:PhzF family phenazine biosynthesis protein [Dyella amyloliquefaciens]|uniref:PhzF family phenazine biosynthesis protein n=1 Tax=Dyella amyloliquefaciens TaxID=1770545 RepID=UPI00102E9AC8|nr:PhzF family phenazine biosynthesis protein [Dyella amyloliquefaciens]